MDQDDTLEPLELGECLRLLGTAPVGRVVFTQDALPAAQPVNFTPTADGIVFRTRAGGGLDLAVCGAVVGFEADAYDAELGGGWSVLVVGRAEEVTDPVERRELETAVPPPWAGGRRERLLRVPYDRVTGRRAGSRVASW
ncbi:MAG: pyridoxamine 5'-phosphate oxidase family protein [Pseudonocardia sp.]